jgi:hypothetical protein
VPESLGDDARVSARLEEKGRRRVSKVMESEPRQSRTIE